MPGIIAWLTLNRNPESKGPKMQGSLTLCLETEYKVFVSWQCSLGNTCVTIANFAHMPPVDTGPCPLCLKTSLFVAQ